MRTITAYYLLLLYLLALCKPIVPIVQDGLAHIFWQAEHIATVHQHQGSHHAEAETAASTGNDENKKLPASAKISEPVSVHIIAQSSCPLYPPLPEKIQFATPAAALASVTLTKHYPPPRFV